MDTTELLTLAEDAARRTGALLLERFRRPARGVGTKSSPTDLVSDADRDAESFLLGLIHHERPHDGVLGEEGGERAGAGELTWIVDPLDGTVNFLYGIPAWCVSVAARDRDGLLVGVIHDPNRDETFVAIRGAGAALDGAPIQVSDERDISKALVATGFSYDAGIRAHQAKVVASLLPKVRDVRRGGSAALDFCALACGRVDAFYESWFAPWDRSAGELIAREAGAVVTDLPPPSGDEVGVVGANPELHRALEVLVRA